MKYLLITMLLGVGYSQCDWNSDDLLNILDVVATIDCILNGCEPPALLIK